MRNILRIIAILVFLLLILVGSMLVYFRLINPWLGPSFDQLSVLSGVVASKKWDKSRGAANQNLLFRIADDDSDFVYPNRFPRIKELADLLTEREIVTIWYEEFVWSNMTGATIDDGKTNKMVWQIVKDGKESIGHGEIINTLKRQNFGRGGLGVLLFLIGSAGLILMLCRKPKQFRPS